MADSIQAPASNAVQWDEKVVFPTLADDVRRRLFLNLARNGPQTAEALRGGRQVSIITKHLAVMRDAGLVCMRENPKDGRRYLYELHPTVPVMKTEEGAVVDFGFCMFRL